MRCYLWFQKLKSLQKAILVEVFNSVESRDLVTKFVMKTRHCLGEILQVGQVGLVRKRPSHSIDQDSSHQVVVHLTYLVWFVTVLHHESCKSSEIWFLTKEVNLFQSF